MTSRPLFTTLFYEANLNDTAFVEGLGEACRRLAETDVDGQWRGRAAVFHGYRGYTSYGSKRDLAADGGCFGELARRLDAHVAAFSQDCAFDLGGRSLKLAGLWVNLLSPGGAHSGHIHPHCVVSGTVYVSVPPGSGPLKLEDPRLPMLMAAPVRRGDAPEELRSMVYAKPLLGSVYLWESWLRHEVAPNTGQEDRISISFNYR
jgi:uncharacterized protein (TIGR02466 family)